MKNFIIANIFFVLLLSSISAAQSDYEMVQSFKERYQKLNDDIKVAESLDDLNSIVDEIVNLKRDFSAKKEILDQSLYPEDYNSSFEKLFAAIELRRGDFTTIDVLKVEVTNLKSEMDVLNKKNDDLLNQIARLESLRKKDAETIAQLESLVSNLRATILKRDELIFGIIDSLTPKLAADVSTMTPQDKEQIYSQVEKNNIITLVKKSLRDNRRFLEVTSLKANDLTDVKKQEQEFVSMWQKVGPKLIDVYSAKGEKTNDLKEIDNLFTVWSNRINREAWESINEEFSFNNINLQNFANGKEFTTIVIKFITDEIKNYGVKDKKESEQVYSTFADSVWFKNFSSEWIPFLIDNNLLTTEQKDEIEKKIAEWKSIVHPQNLTWIYLLAGAIVIVAIASLLFRKKKPQDTPPAEPQTEN